MPILNKTLLWDVEGMCMVRCNINFYCHPVEQRRNSLPGEQGARTARNLMIKRRPKAGFKQCTFH